MSLPLSGYTVLVTRPARQAAGLARLIEERGGTAEVLPLIHPVRLQEEWNQQLRILKELTYDWVVFTSANAVRFFQEALEESNTALLKNVRIAAVGRKTAKSLQKAGWEIDLMPDDFYAEELAKLLRKKVKAGERVLFPKSARARNVIPAVLNEAGVLVTEMPLYTSAPLYENKYTLQQLVREKRLDVLTFASPSSVKVFCGFLKDMETSMWENIPVICIGPITQNETDRFGFKNIRSAKPYTVEGMVDALVAMVKC
ncbi:uroporphyrinogen-III synthase [Alteribacillus sp. JSM 102045]|uniref:uroporphyrinogen-III synthase n=1 Tax=Alteribacillus sp. JSM 102045 TaxID=1562101 RepID=UPI0035BF64D3